MIPYLSTKFIKNTGGGRTSYKALFSNKQNPNHEKFCQTNDPVP